MPASARQSRVQRLPVGLGDVRVGTIVEIVDGRPHVTLGGDAAPVPARVACTAPPGLGSPHDWLDRPVLLLLEEGDPQRPIIVGLVGDTLPGFTAGTTDVEVDGRRVMLEGREQVVLRCGDASITLTADGQVVVKGTRVVSRASESNKIRGATVLIN